MHVCIMPHKLPVTLMIYIRRKTGISKPDCILGMQTMQCMGGMATTTTATVCVLSSHAAAGVQDGVASVEGLVPQEEDTAPHPDALSTGSLFQVSRLLLPITFVRSHLKLHLAVLDCNVQCNPLRLEGGSLLHLEVFPLSFLLWANVPVVSMYLL